MTAFAGTRSVRCDPKGATMLDLFASLPKDTRKGRLRDYRDYLIDRDGELNLPERKLARREESIERYETPPKTLRDMDEAEFRRQYTSFDKRNPPSQEMLLILALV